MNSNDGVRCYRYINCFSDAMAQRWKSHATRPLMLPDGSTRCTNSTPIKFYIGWHQQHKSDWGIKKENFNVISSRIGEWKKRWRRRRKQKGRFELFFFGFFRNLRQSLATCPTSRQSDKGLAIATMRREWHNEQNRNKEDRVILILHLSFPSIECVFAPTSVRDRVDMSKR